MTDEPIKIAVIDDNEAMTDLLVGILNEMPTFQVVGQAYDGQAGLVLIKETKPAVVILDLCMPYIDGLGVLESFQATKQDYFPEFIITTCVGQENITSKAMKLGANYYVVKPFNYEYFINRLNQLAFELRNVPEKLEESVVLENYSNHTSSMVSEILQELGVPSHTKGYAYLKDAISLIHTDVKYMNKITKVLYPKIAEIQETTPSRVERGIRTAVELTLLQGNQYALIKYFGYRIKTSNNKLTNSEFISIISEKIKIGIH